jgi:hypothetical protein
MAEIKCVECISFTIAKTYGDDKFATKIIQCQHDNCFGDITTVTPEYGTVVTKHQRLRDQSAFMMNATNECDSFAPKEE